MRIDTVEEDGKFTTQGGIEKAQLGRLSYRELCVLEDQMDDICDKIRICQDKVNPPGVN